MTTKRRGGRRPLSGIRDGQFHVRCTEEERACVPQAIVVDPKVSPSQKRHVDKPAIYTVD